MEKTEVRALVEELSSRAVPVISIAELLGISDRYVRYILDGSHPKKVSEILPESVLKRCAEFRQRKITQY